MWTEMTIDGMCCHVIGYKWKKRFDEFVIVDFMVEFLVKKQLLKASLGSERISKLTSNMTKHVIYVIEIYQYSVIF